MSLALLALALSVGAVATEPSRASEPRLASSLPEQEIARGESEWDWPFSIERGRLTCIESQGQRYVFFSEILTPEEMGEFGAMKLPRMVVVSANPLAYLATLDNRELYLPWDSLETLIKRLAPYERMGWELCDGATTPPDSTDL
jgi:hypothetical protein